MVSERLIVRSSMVSLPVELKPEFAKNCRRCPTRETVAVVSDHADGSAATRRLRIRWDPYERHSVEGYTRPSNSITLQHMRMSPAPIYNIFYS